MSQSKRKIQMMSITAMLIAVGVLIPMYSPVKIMLEPMSFTLGSHIAIMIAMFVSPLSALGVALGTTAGFYLAGFTLPVVLRALTHVVWAYAGALYLKKHPDLFQSPAKTFVFNLAVAIVHAVLEVIIVMPLYTGYDASQLFYLLFVLVGAEVDLNSIGGIWLPVLGVILGALAFRCAGVFLCLLRTRLCLKERLFCMLAYGRSDQAYRIQRKPEIALTEIKKTAGRSCLQPEGTRGSLLSLIHSRCIHLHVDQEQSAFQPCLDMDVHLRAQLADDGHAQTAAAALSGTISLIKALEDAADIDLCRIGMVGKRAVHPVFFLTDDDRERCASIPQRIDDQILEYPFHGIGIHHDGGILC